ncbi:MAG: PorT family protein [Rikenellaceae bacterium]|jgi:hypothetical protein|nr:PorT family protein [Rikenellaceae bacterium]
MKKIVLVLAVLTLTTATASAQLFRLGVKGGVSMLATDVKAVSDAGQSDQWDEFKSKGLGWNAGLMARINVPLIGLYVQPELLYNHATYQMFDKSGKSTDVDYGNIELPVLVGFKFLFLRVNAGPTFTLANIEGSDVLAIEKPSVGFQAGVGLGLKKFTLDVRYQGYFDKEWGDIKFDDVTDKLKTNDGYWGVSLGYFF